MEKIKIENSKGTHIAAVVHYPEKKTEKLAILCPGFLDTKDCDHLVRLAEALAARGYTAVRFDPTGTWESEGSITDYLTSQYLDDIKSVLEYMLGEGNFAHVLLGGHSRGGMVSLLYAARDSRVSVALGIMPSSGRYDGKKREEWEKTGFQISYRDIPGSVDKKEFRVPFANVKDRDQYDVLNDVKKIHVPAIFIAGEIDALVPPEDVKELFDNANEPKKYIMMEGMGHDYRKYSAEVRMLNNEIVGALTSLLGG